ncbi:hypothetical protein BZG36_04532 [Bifiguratus adelaidae]|uniref:NADH:flavin oxidoreductase/NADH oxidase N-terminal domain-containing protein n=1 Tax=Bifiguratus adelaidae TaxID=1938954 RepID=A0A261XXW3_9FUNG|nr:hypothetical protein BZG36_04532 [Bifiguratus adelaidae]
MSKHTDAAQETTPLLSSHNRGASFSSTIQQLDDLESGWPEDESETPQPEDAFQANGGRTRGDLVRSRPVYGNRDLSKIPIAKMVHRIRQQVEDAFESPLSWSSLVSPEIDITLIRPLVVEWREEHNLASVYTWLLVRCHFLKESSSDIGNAKLFETRANVCEIVATRLLKSFPMRSLIHVLTFDFSPTQGSDMSRAQFSPNAFEQSNTTSSLPQHLKMFPHSLQDTLSQSSFLNHSQHEPPRMNAIEVAIEGYSKWFLANNLVQEVLNEIWQGNIVFFAAAFDEQPMTFPSHRLFPAAPPRSMSSHGRRWSRRGSNLPMVQKSVSLHDNTDIRLFQLSRLRVPKYKSFVSAVMFAIFIILYTVVLFQRSKEVTIWEVALDLFTLGFTVDEILQFANSGATVYFENIWNMFDFAILLIFIGFFSLRMRWISYNGHASPPDDSPLHQYDFAFDLLACNSILLWPRLFAVLDHYRFFGTMLIVIRHMMIDASLFFTLLFVFFLGFLQAFYALGRDSYSYSEIAWLMLKVFFGSQYIGFDVAFKLHPIFGPIVMTLYISISTLVLMTILISIFNQSFSTIISNAHEEYLFLFSIKVLEHIQSDQLYEFMPPFNLIQVAILSPLSHCLPGDTFSKLNQGLMKVIFFPVLLGIYLYEWILYKTGKVHNWKPDLGVVGRSVSYAAVPIPLMSNAGFQNARPGLKHPHMPRQNSKVAQGVQWAIGLPNDTSDSPLPLQHAPDETGQPQLAETTEQSVSRGESHGSSVADTRKQSVSPSITEQAESAVSATPMKTKSNDKIIQQQDVPEGQQSLSESPEEWKVEPTAKAPKSIGDDGPSGSLANADQDAPLFGAHIKIHPSQNASPPRGLNDLNLQVQAQIGRQEALEKRMSQVMEACSDLQDVFVLQPPIFSFALLLIMANNVKQLATNIAPRAWNVDRKSGSATGTHNSYLFKPFTQKSLTLRNSMVVSPMCTYSADDGLLNDFHLVHLGNYALRGAGLVFVEATAVEPQGRISPGDSGIWSDDHIEPLKRIVDFLHVQGAKAAIQLAHAGRKASTSAPWDPFRIVPEAEGGWPNDVWGPSDVPFNDKHAKPIPLTKERMQSIIKSFVAATERALKAGFDIIEIHGAHGYLIHSFLSGNSNFRTDEYGGSLENRMRFPLEILKAVREVWPQDRPLWWRVSAADWKSESGQALDPDPKGWDIYQTVEFAKELKKGGVELIDCSSGGNVPLKSYPTGPGYQVPFAEKVRKEVGIPTGAVGMITEVQQAEDILKEGKADVVLMAREMLRDPEFPQRAGVELKVDVQWAKQFERAKPRL